MADEYQWSFQVKDVVNFEGTTITVNANTYNAAIRKVKGLKLPQLRTFDDIEEGIRLISAIEIGEELDGGELETAEDEQD